MLRFSLILLGLAMSLITPCVAQDSTQVDARVVELVEAFNANQATEEQTLQLLALVLQDPERLERAGANPDRLRPRLLQDSVVTQRTWNPALAPPTGHRPGDFPNADAEQAERLFQQALDAAPSDEVRADYLFLREQRGYGGGGCAHALEIFPSHAPCLYQSLNALGRRVGTQRSLTGRFNYWCLADRYRQLAASTDDSRIASAARNAAKQYDRSGPTREQFVGTGYRSGQMVSCDIVGGTTPVR